MLRSIDCGMRARVALSKVRRPCAAVESDDVSGARRRVTSLASSNPARDQGELLVMLSQGTLLGRAAELESFRAAIAGLPDGRREVWLLRGEPGIGKSALLAEAVRIARGAGVGVLRLSGVESEASTPFAGLHQLLGGVLDDVDALPEPERGALRAAFGIDASPRPDPYLIARATVLLLGLVAGREPVLIVADDLHWVDAQSNDVLAFLAAAPPPRGVLIIGAARASSVGYLGDARELLVERLDEATSSALLRRHAPDLAAPQRERVMSDAAGNPLALIELPLSVGDAGHPSPYGTRLDLSARLEEAFAARVADLPPVTHDAVLIAATDHGEALVEILAATSVLTGRGVSEEHLAPAVELGLLEVGGGAVRFRHPLVRSGVLQSEPLTRRQAAHAALAAVVTDDVFRQVWHRAQAIIGPDDEVAAALEEVAANCVRRGAVLSAITMLERAAELAGPAARRGHLLLVAAEHAFDLGRNDLVDRLLSRARALGLTGLDQARLQWLSEIFHDGTPGDAARVHELCDNALLASGAGDADLALNLLLGAALRCWWADAGQLARRRVTETAQRIGLTGDARYVAALAVAEPVARGREVLRLLSGRRPADATESRLLGMAAHAVGDSPRASDLLDLAEAELRAQGRLGVLTQVLSMQVVVRLEIGDVHRAVAAMAEGLELAERTGQRIWTTGTLVCAARAEAVRGDVERALELAVQAEFEADQLRLNDLLACVQVARGIAQLDAGRAAEAFDALQILFDPKSRYFHERERFDGLMFLAEAAATGSQRAAARAIVAGLEAVAELTPSPLLHVHLAFARAVLADDENLYRAALADDLSRWPWPRARLEHAFGRWLAGAGRLAEARPWLASATRTFDEIGTPTWAIRAGRELAAIDASA